MRKVKRKKADSFSVLFIGEDFSLMKVFVPVIAALVASVKGISLNKFVEEAIQGSIRN
jgi:hypothetical protein